MKKLIPYLLLFVFISCSFNGSFQGLYSYYDKTKKENPSLLIDTDTITSVCEIKKTDTPKIYIARGAQFKECLKEYDDLIIYIWAPKCKSKFCYSLDLLQENCNFEGVELLVVAEYYDTKSMEENYTIKKPIFGIDTEYYKTSLTSSYLSKFISDIKGKKSDNAGRFIYFRKGNYIQSFASLDSLQIVKKIPTEMNQSRF